MNEVVLIITNCRHVLLPRGKLIYPHIKPLTTQWVVCVAPAMPILASESIPFGQTPLRQNRAKQGSRNVQSTTRLGNEASPSQGVEGGTKRTWRTTLRQVE